MKIKFDTHTHTTISDGGNTPEEMLKKAAEKGFEFLTVTDHFDIHERFPEKLSRFDGAGREESYNALSELKKRDYGVKFLNGIEIAQAHRHKEIAENWLNSHDYDFVLGSCHIIRGQVDFYHIDYGKNDPDLLLKQYFDELIELCKWCSCDGADRKFDSLAHLTYPLRYMSGFGNIALYKDNIDELFAIMIKGEIALEINTAGDILCPEQVQIERYRELGGRLVTIGSDSHSVDTIGQRIDVGIRAAKTAGFNECVYYENRNPHFIKI
ncbi:MAG: histidinol-phosphatase HisJ family protein [Oscillospiraceae bacterium]|nr:histidinol-phosphatase HisJ family protein [Oscillospiraceae bacterium]